MDSMRTFLLSTQESANMSPDLAAHTVPRGSFRLAVTSLGMPLLFAWIVPVTVMTAQWQEAGYCRKGRCRDRILDGEMALQESSLPWLCVWEVTIKQLGLLAVVELKAAQIPSFAVG